MGYQGGFDTGLSRRVQHWVIKEGLIMAHHGGFNHGTSMRVQSWHITVKSWRYI